MPESNVLHNIVRMCTQSHVCEKVELGCFLALKCCEISVQTCEPNGPQPQHQDFCLFVCVFYRPRVFEGQKGQSKMKGKGYKNKLKGYIKRLRASDITRSSPYRLLEMFSLLQIQ